MSDLMQDCKRMNELSIQVMAIGEKNQVSLMEYAMFLRLISDKIANDLGIVGELSEQMTQ